MQRDPEAREKQFITDIFSPPAGDVLEIGSGDGRLTKILSGMCSTLTALDPEMSSLMEARSAVPDPVRFLSGSGEQLPLVDACVDTVVFSLSLHHQNAVNGLAEARRVVRKGGRILVMEPVEDSPMTLLFAFVHDEAGKYAQARAAIEGSGLGVLQSGSIRTRWVFEDFTEMAGYIFGYFGLRPDQEKERGMATLLGDRPKHHPLNIEDTTSYWLLRG